MSDNAIDSESISKPTPDTVKPKGARKAGKKAKPAKKAGRAKKASAKPKAERANKKAEVIAMMKRAKRPAGSHTRASSASGREHPSAVQNRTECFARYGVIWRREFQKPYGSGPTSFQEHLPNGHMLKTLGHGFEAVPSQVRIAPTIWRSPSGVRSSFMI
jgi:hypothetical protein